MSVETIFDHSVTPDEVLAITGIVLSEKQYLDRVTDADSEWSALYSLFLVRGNPDRADEYFKKIKSDELRRAIIEVNEGTT